MKNESNPNDKIIIKTADEIERMRVAGRLAAQVLDMITPSVVEGISTDELNKICHDYMVNVQKVIPAPLNYRGFPKSICTSVNYQVCHGVPNHKPLKNGDIINIDITVVKDGFHGDTSRMFSVGKPTVASRRIISVSNECLLAGITQVKPGNTFGDIGYVVEQHARKNHCSVVHEYCGHGIGRYFHEPPHVLHYGKPKTGDVLVPGMTFTIEPMVNLGKRHVKKLSDNWTVVTKDRSLSAQWEHTLLVTESGCDILTLGSGT